EKVGYDVRLKNNTGEKIRGTLKAFVKNYKGEQVFNQEMGFTMDARRSFSTDLKLENNLTVPGFYQLMIAINAGRYN
ncbi:hypothetical protein ACPXAZ_26000, partial [Escherichia coli]|uniref:hypothetical protein n=1 Tax=Escherichia coli TaxID=562 RepID=UPI003CE4E2ED